MKKLPAKLALPLAGMLACGMLFHAGDHGRISVFVGPVHPCVQDPRNSFPCNGMFDICAMAAALVLGLACFVICCLRVFAEGRTVWPAKQDIQAGATPFPTKSGSK